MQVGGVQFRIKVDIDRRAIQNIRAMNNHFANLERQSLKTAVSLRAIGEAINGNSTATKRILGQQRRLNQVQRQLAASAKQVAAAQRQVAKAQQHATQQTIKATSATNHYTESTHAATAALSAFGVGFASMKIGEFVRESTALAGRVEVLETVLNRVGANAGYTAGELSTAENAVKRLGITTRVSREALVQATRANIDLSKATQLARISQDAAVIAGENSSETYRNILIGIQNLQPRLLRHRGIITSLPSAYAAYSAETGKAINSLTESEKQQALLNATLTEGKKISGAYVGAMEHVAKQHLSLERHIEEARKEFGKNYIPLWRDLVAVVGTAAKAYQAAGPAAQVASSGLATATVAATGLTTAYLGIRSALAAYTVLQDMATKKKVVDNAITDATNAKLTTHAALTGQVTKATKAATVATWSFGGALKSIPVSAWVIGGLTALTTAYQVMTAAVERAREAREAEALEAEREAASLMRLAHGVEQVRELEKANDGSEQATLRLSNAVENLKINARDAGVEVDGLRGSVELLGAIQDSAPEALKGQEAIVDRLREKVRKAKQELKDFQDRQIVVGGPGGTVGREARKDELATALEKQNRELESAVSTKEAIQLRALKVPLQNLEAAAEASAKVREKVAEIHSKSIKSASVEILNQYRELHEQLSEGIATEQEIIQAAELELAQRKRQIDADHADQLKAADGEDAKQKIRNQIKEAKLLAEVEVTNTKRANLVDRKAAIEAREELLKLTEQQLAAEAQLISNLEERNRLEAEGVKPEVIKIRQEMREADQAHAKAMADLNQRGQADSRYARLQEKRHHAEQRDRLAELLRLQREARDEQIDMVRELSDEVADLEGRTTRMTVDQVRARIDARKQEFEQVQDFIRDTKIGLADEKTPGAGQIMRTHDQFREQIGKASTGGQLDQLGQLFPQELARVNQRAQQEQESIGKQIATARDRLASGYRSGFQRGGHVGAMQSTAADRKKLFELLKKQAELQQQVARRAEITAQAERSIAAAIAAQRGQLEAKNEEQSKDKQFLDQIINKKKLQLAQERESLRLTRGKTAELQKQLNLMAHSGGGGAVANLADSPIPPPALNPPAVPGAGGAPGGGAHFDPGPQLFEMIQSTVDADPQAEAATRRAALVAAAKANRPAPTPPWARGAIDPARASPSCLGKPLSANPSRVSWLDCEASANSTDRYSRANGARPCRIDKPLSRSSAKRIVRTWRATSRGTADAATPRHSQPDSPCRASRNRKPRNRQPIHSKQQAFRQPNKRQMPRSKRPVKKW